jgi:hypothetical protein
MRAALATLVLAAVLAASVANLVLGAAWVAAVVAILLVRRRLRLAAWLVLLLAVAGGAAAASRGWLGPPPATSFAPDDGAAAGRGGGWLGWLAGLGRPPAPPGPADLREAARGVVAARRLAEFRHSARQLEQRAVTAIGVSRDVGRLRSRAPAQVTALEEAVRQLALTLTAPEFRDLDGRETRLALYFAELEARAAQVRDQADLDAVLRAVDPAATATVSLRALRDDLARVAAASAAVVGALGGGTVTARAASTWRYDEGQGRLIEERRVTLEATPPLRITRVDPGSLRLVPGGPPPLEQALSVGADGAEGQAVSGGGDVVLGPDGAGRVVLVERQARAPALSSIGSPLRPVRFVRLAVPGGGLPPPDFPVRVRIGDGDGPGAEPFLVVEAEPFRLERIQVPAHALHHASRPGAVRTGPDGDEWTPAAPLPVPAPPVGLDLAPPGLLRLPPLARARPYLYGPSLPTGLGVVALAALTVVILPARRPAGPVTPPGAG